MARNTSDRAQDWRGDETHPPQGLQDIYNHKAREAYSSLCIQVARFLSRLHRRIVVHLWRGAKSQLPFWYIDRRRPKEPNRYYLSQISNTIQPAMEQEFQLASKSKFPKRGRKAALGSLMAGAMCTKHDPLWTLVFDIWPCLSKYYAPCIWESWAIVDYVVIPLIVVDLDTFHKALVITIMENDTIGIHCIRLWCYLVCIYQWTTAPSLERWCDYPAVYLIFSSRMKIGLCAVSVHYTHTLPPVYFLSIRYTLEIRYLNIAPACVVK